MDDTGDGYYSDSGFPSDILFVYGSLRMGGIETLIVRLANFFVSVGSRVSVYCNLGGVLEPFLSNDVKLIFYIETSDLIRVLQASQNFQKDGTRYLVLSFDPISAARGLMIETTFSHSRDVVHVSGVFHPQAYFMTGERRDRVFLNYMVARAIGKNSLFFMNEECKDSHSVKWSSNLEMCNILPLPINSLAANWNSSDKAIVRIVSVGRLVDFKTYNLGIAKIVKECCDSGIEVTWDIYGEGVLQATMLKEIRIHNLDNHIRLMGELEYSLFPETVARYDLFVGMGTSALEAAMVGVPTICATINEATRCYGYINCLPFGNVGERQKSPPARQLSELIQKYSAFEQEQRLMLSKQCRATAERYSMPEFSEALVSMAFGKNHGVRLSIKRSVAIFYKFMTEGRLAKFVRSHSASKTTFS